MFLTAIRRIGGVSEMIRSELKFRKYIAKPEQLRRQIFHFMIVAGRMDPGWRAPDRRI